MTEIHVGGARADLTEARTFVHRYLNTPTEHWAYPAYDTYGGGAGELSGPDLLAPILLNVSRISVRTYDELYAGLAAINERLSVPALDHTLAEGGPDTIDALVNLFGLLDDPGYHGVRLTTFTKILHRKRPATVPLYDEHIRRCYQEIGDPIRLPSEQDRSWRRFARAWLTELQADLVGQRQEFEDLAKLAPAPGITALRALDIVGWGLGDPKHRLPPESARATRTDRP